MRMGAVLLAPVFVIEAITQRLHGLLDLLLFGTEFQFHHGGISKGMCVEWGIGIGVARGGGLHPGSQAKS